MSVNDLPNLTAEQAAEAIDLMTSRMPDQKLAAKVNRNMKRGWHDRDHGMRFTVFAIYYGLANYRGRGVVDGYALVQS
jgi:hypothetical protein